MNGYSLPKEEFVQNTTSPKIEKCVEEILSSAVLPMKSALKQKTNLKKIQIPPYCFFFGQNWNAVLKVFGLLGTLVSSKQDEQGDGSQNKNKFVPFERLSIVQEMDLA